MVEDTKPTEQPLFKALLVERNVKSARVFRSPGPAMNFLAEMSVERIVIGGLGHWKADT